MAYADDAHGGGGSGGGGAQCVGEFVLGRTLGVGATGKVKLGTHKVTGLKVAIKIISKEALSERPGMRRKMEREIAVLRLVNHPNVMQLFDVYETSRYLFLILEYVEGGELFDHLVRKGRLLPEEALKFFQQMMLGVEYCHKHMVCHRDLKPENLLLDENSNVKLADFGMASLMKSDSLLETSCGSPHYACPEVVTGQAYSGEAADVWSAGVILYALLTGKLPFDDDNIRRLLKKVKAGRYAMPAWVSADIKDLISRMLTVDPARRITVDEIKAHPWFNSMPYEAPPVRPVSDAITSAAPISDPDADILASLVSLGWGEGVDLPALLASDAKSVAKVFYHLLDQRKAEVAASFGVASGGAAPVAMDVAAAAPPPSVASSYAPASMAEVTGYGTGSPVAADAFRAPPGRASPAIGRYARAGGGGGGGGDGGAVVGMDIEGGGARAGTRPAPVPLSQSVPTSNAYALAASYGVPIPAARGGDAAAGYGGVAGTPRFHRHAGVPPPSVAASPPVSSSPHISWFSNMFPGPGGGGAARPAIDAPAPMDTVGSGSPVTDDAPADAAAQRSRSAIVSQINVPFRNTTAKALGTKVALALHGARCKFRRNSMSVFKAKCNYGGVILKFKILVAPPSADASPDIMVSFLLQAGLPESFAALVDQLSADMRALNTKPAAAPEHHAPVVDPLAEDDDVDLANMEHSDD